MSPQQTIAHYRITAEFGDGGMGLRLKPAATSSRKVLPDAAIVVVKTQLSYKCRGRDDHR
jgi:hypothetical protein